MKSRRSRQPAHSKLTRMANPQDRMRVLRAIEELLEDRRPDQRQVDTNMVCQRMLVEGEQARDEVAQAMNQLLDDGYVVGKPLRGDNKALDVTVTAITEKGSKLLWK